MELVISVYNHMDCYYIYYFHIDVDSRYTY